MRMINHSIPPSYTQYQYKAGANRVFNNSHFGLKFDHDGSKDIGYTQEDNELPKRKSMEQISPKHKFHMSSKTNEDIIPQPTTSNESESSDISSDLILSTYMRSGSTVIGEVFGDRLDTFYLFEPLWRISKFQFYKGRDSICHYYLPQCVNISDGQGEMKSSYASLNFLQSALDCKLYKYPDFLMNKSFKEFSEEKHDWTFYKGYGWKSFTSCAEKNNSTFKECLRATEASCTSAKHRVIKLLRMTMDNLDILLQRNKNLKIIHLFRDPRGILSSHLRTSWFGRKHKDMQDFVKNDTKVMCERMLIDLNAGKNLQIKFPGRVKFIQYEDVGNILQKRMHVLNGFADFKLSEEQSKIISGAMDLNKYTDQRGFHPYSYRSKLSWDTVRICDRECSEILKQLGYTLYKSESHLRNMSQPAALDPLPFAV